MTNRADEIALRSLLCLSGALALVIAVRFTSFDFGFRSISKVANNADEVVTRFLLQTPTPSPELAQRREPPAVEQVQEVPTITPIPISRLTHIRVGPSHWSVPIRVMPGESVGIRFSLGRIQVERNGAIAGILYRNPIVLPNRNGITIRPLASLDRTPRIVWFEKEVRLLRFVSLEKQTEEVEVLWKGGGR